VRQFFRVELWVTAWHEVLQEEVTRLQDLSASNVERLAQIQARNLEKYPLLTDQTDHLP
jgi:hypothetical protein